MTKQEIKRATDNALIVEYIRSYHWSAQAERDGSPRKRIDAHCKDLEQEIVKRNILTDEDIKYLNS